MYNCYRHGWTSRDGPCPSCFISGSACTVSAVQVTKEPHPTPGIDSIQPSEAIRNVKQNPAELQAQALLEEIINGMPFSPQKSWEWREWFRRIYRGHALDLDAAFKHYDFNGLEDDVLDKLQEVYHGPAKAEYCPKHVRVMERPILKDECDQCKEEQS